VCTLGVVFLFFPVLSHSFFIFGVFCRFRINGAVSAQPSIHIRWTK
jgi:hypothetical protein